MTAIIAGAGWGLENTSARILGGRGLLGAATQGRGGDQVYVNAATGNLVVQKTDDLLIGRGPDIGTVRTYNSLGQYTDDVDNWRWNAQRKVTLVGTENAATSTLRLTGWDGSVTDYAYDTAYFNQTGKHRYVSTAGDGAYDTIVRWTDAGVLPSWQQTAATAAGVANNSWIFTDGSTQIIEAFDGGVGGQVLKSLNLDGDAITYAYGANGLVSTITTANGESTAYEYWAGTNNLKKITTNVGGTLSRVSYAYTADRLTKVTVDLTPENGADSVIYETNYEYNAAGKVSAIWQTDGSRLEITYYTPTDPEAIADPSIVGRVKQLSQKVEGSEYRITKFAYFSDRTEITDPLLNVTTLYYDDPDAPQQLSRIVGPPPHANAQPLEIAKFNYDLAGNVWRVTDGAGKNTDYQFDANGNVTQITDPNGNVTVRAYDDRNSLIRETRTGSFSGGTSTSLIARYVYDAENHLAYTISAEGHVTEYGYNTYGQLTQKTEYPQHPYALGAEVPTLAAMNAWRNGLADRSSVKICAYTYDPRGNLSAAIEYGGASSMGAPIQTEGYRHTTTVYDQAGLLLSRATAPEAAETFVYDGLGRMILSTNLTGATTSVIFQDAATTTIVKTAMSYNETTQAWQESASTYVTTSVYNKAGDLIQVVKPAETGETGGTQYYYYDKGGRPRVSIDATGKKTYVLYDDAGRKVADIGHQGEVAEYRYDAASRVVAVVRYMNRLTSQQVTDLNNLTLEIDIEVGNWRPAAHAQDIWQWSVYDQGGRAIETVMGDGSVAAYEYDSADRLIKATGYANKLVQTQIDAFKQLPPTTPAVPFTLPTADAARDRITRSFYDRDGRLIGALNAEGFLTQIVYDEAGQKIGETAFANATNPVERAGGSFDTLLDSIADPARDIATRYVYDGQGLLRFTIDAIGRVTENIYWQQDPWFWYANGRPRKTVSYVNELGSVPDYSYAAMKAAVAAPGFADAANDRTSYAVYDEHGQIVYSVDADGAVAGFVYDEEGRVTRTTRYATTIDMNVQGAVFQHRWWLDQWALNNGADARVARTYYNNRGDVIFKFDAENYLTQYEYDAEGRLTAEHRWSLQFGTNEWDLNALIGAAKGTALTTKYGYDWSGRLSDVWDAAGTRRSKIYWATGTLGLETVAYQQGTDESRIQYTYDQAGKLIGETRFASEAANAWAVGSAKTQLNGGERLLSPNQQYSAVLTREGELRVYHWGEQVWTNGVRDTTAGATFRLVAENDGELVVYRDVSGQSSTPIWSAGGGYAGATFLEMKDSGEFGLYKGTPGSSSGSVWTIQTASVPVSPYMQQWLVTTYAYDGLGNVAKVTDARGNATDFTHDKVGRIRARTDALGGVTQFEYDAFGRGVKTIDARGNASYLYFDRMSRVTDAVDSENYVTHTAYTAFGEVASVTRHYNRAASAPTLSAPPPATASGLDATTRYKYDKLGRVTLLVDSEDYVTKTGYTDFGEVASVKRFYLRTSNPTGLAEPAAHALDATTTFQYDDLSRVTQTTDAEGASEIYVLDAYGNRARTTNKVGGVYDRTFDGVGRVVTETIWYTESQAAGAPKTVNRYVYDRRGNLIAKVEAEGASVQRTTTYEYDKQNRLVRTTGETVDIYVTSTNASATSLAPTERFFYDKNGNLAEKIDAAGARTLFWYDKLNRVTHKLSPLGTLTTYAYDPNGDVTETRVHATRIALPAHAAAAAPVPVVHADDRVTLFVYDKLGRVVRTDTPSITTAAYFVDFATATQTLAVRYDYDAMGRVVRMTDANGAQTDSFYDKLGRKIIEIDAENYRTDWTYDSEGNVLSERRYATRVAFAERNLFRGGDLSQGTAVFQADWDGGTGVNYAQAVETVDGEAALTLRKMGGTWQSYGGADDRWGGSVVGRSGDLSDGKWSVTAGETLGFAFEVKQLFAEDELRVFAHFVFYDAQGQAIAYAPATNWDADDWQRANGVVVVPANAVAAELRFGSYRTDANGAGRMDFAVRKIQVHKLASGASPSSVPAWSASALEPALANLFAGGDLSQGTSFFHPDWDGGAGGHYAKAIETIGGRAALTLRKSGGTYQTYGGALDRWGGAVTAYSGDRPDGKWSVSAGETVGFAFEVTQLFASDPLKVFAQFVFYNAQGQKIAWAPTANWDADDWQRASGVIAAPAGAVAFELRFGSYRTDGNGAGRMDFAVRSIQVHRLPAGATPSSIPAWNAAPALPTAAPITSPDDRVTNFTYDRMGRRLSETRTGVDVHNGSGGTVAQNATITFEYNALGQVEKKFEATNASLVDADLVYEYDAQGRLIVEKHASFLDFNNQTVTPTIEYNYDGLDNLIETRALGKDGDGVQGFNPLFDTADRVTTYTYDGAGRLFSMTDAEGFTRTYRYDAAGRKVREEYVRIMPTGSANEAIGYDYDLEGRIVRQGLLVSPDADGPWIRNGASIDTAAMKYNAFGEVSERGMIHYDAAGQVSDERYAEQFLYDQAGRVWKTSSGDGVWKLFMHDAAGNQTLMIASDGEDLSSMDTIAEAFQTYWANAPGAVETTNAAGVVATLTKYDARNRATKAFEPRRELSATQIEDLWTSRVYNAFGEVVQEASALGHDAADRIIDTASVKYTYNTMGRLIKTESPQVLITYANAQGQEQIDQLARPTEHRYYDIGGRLVAAKDANGHLTRMTLLAGTGFGGSQGLATAVTTADSSSVTTSYDIHGQARRVADQLNRVTQQTFDAMGRLVELRKPGGLVEYFAYDGLGQRIERWNSHYGNYLATDVERTFYDAQGRIEKHYAMGGDLTSYAYAWAPNIQTDVGAYGGWTQTTTYANTMQLIENSDLFGRTTYRRDLGLHATDFSYDEAGRLARKEGAGAVALNYDYYNTGLVQSVYTDLIDPTLKDDEGALYLELYADVRQVAFENMPWGGNQNWLDDSDIDAFDYAIRHYEVYGAGQQRANPADLMTKRRTTYGYDKAGNVVAEKLVDEGLPGSPVYVDASASYDALGRLTHWQEAGSSSGGHVITPPASIDYKYDANGNIRNSKATFRTLDAQGNASATDTVQDYWFRYDSLNRVVTHKGRLENGQIVHGFDSVDIIAYDGAGQLAYTLQFSDATVSLPTGGTQPGPYPGSTVPIFEAYNYTQISRRDFFYDDAGRLDRVQIGKSYWNVNDTPSDETDDFVVDPTRETTDLRSDFTYDAMGRLTAQIDYEEDAEQIDYEGETERVIFERTTTYNGKSQILTDETFTWTTFGPKTLRAFSTYEYGLPGTVDYALGGALSIETDNWEIDEQGTETAKPTSLTTNIYQWWDGPVLSQLKLKPDVGQGAENTTTYTYQNIGGAAHLSSVYVKDGRPRTIVFRNDLSGQAIRRDEGDLETPTEANPDYNGDPHEIWHRFNGRQMGRAGNYGLPQGPSGPVDFDQSTAQITSHFEGSAAGSYTVHAGDTLTSIAAQLWGDSSLWYKLAEANGLGGQSTLIEGQILTIPPGVVRNTYNASTFTPYNPNEAIGETLPTVPKAPKGNKCGTFGQILLVIIAVIVTIYATEFAGYAWAAALGEGTAATIAAGATGAAVGSIASQAFGVATGIQEEFSWNAVALAAVGGAVSASGLGAGIADKFKFADGTFLRAATIGAVNNAVTQGVGYAMGWQDEFSWAGVAAAGVGAGVGFQVREHWIGANAPDWARSLAGGAAAAIANAATRSALEGSDFDENIRRAIPDVIGQTIGESIAGGLAQSGEKGMKSAKNFDKGASKDTATLTVQPIAAFDEMALDVPPLTEMAELTSLLPISFNQSGASWTPPAGVVVTDFGTFVDGAPLNGGGGAGALLAQAANVPNAPSAAADTVQLVELPAPFSGEAILNSAVGTSQLSQAMGLAQPVYSPNGKLIALTGLHLTQAEYLQAVENGLWKSLQGDNEHPLAITSNAGVAAASAAVQAAPSVSTADVSTNPSLQGFLIAAAKPTASAHVGDFEKFLSFGTNAQGEIIVTNIALVGSQGAVVTSLVPPGTAAIAHVHYDELVQPPHGGDNSAVKFRNIPSIVFSSDGNRIWEVGRQGGSEVVRRIFNNGSLGSWTPYQAVLPPSQQH